MEIQPSELPDVKIIKPTVFEDPRGFFYETWHDRRYREAGIRGPFVQDNLSCSSKGILRGLHYQQRFPQGKLIWVIQGCIFDVAVDIRHGSPTFGRWVGFELSDANREQAYIPKGFAHGFCVLSDTAHVAYKCTEFYAPGDEGGIIFSDPTLGIKWPVSKPMLSSKDAQLPRLLEIETDQLPVYR
jgi:dTDP-4-dehydrorhamnose 3,5-epimerase